MTSHIQDLRNQVLRKGEHEKEVKKWEQAARNYPHLSKDLTQQQQSELLKLK